MSDSSSVGPLGVDYAELLGPYGVPFVATWFVVLLVFQTSVADSFSNTLGNLVESLRLSHSLAGVTFLAFGNGAPDVFSSLAAFSSGDSSSNPDLGVGGLIGGGLFVVTIVLGSVLVSSDDVEVHAPNTYRDAFFFACGVGYYLTCALGFGSVNAFKASIFVILYVVYAILVMHMERNRKNHRRDDVEANDSMDRPLLLETASMDRVRSHAALSQLQTWLGDSQNDLRDDSVDEDHFTPVDELAMLRRAALNDEDCPFTDEHEHDDEEEEEKRRLEKEKHEDLRFGSSFWMELYWRRIKIDKSSKTLRVQLRKEYAEASALGKIALACVHWPILAVKLFTIPDPQNWSKPFAVAQPFGVYCLSVFAFGSELSRAEWLFVLIGTCVWALFVFFTVHDSKPPKYQLVFVFVGFYSSIVWIYLLASEIVAVVSAVGDAVGANQSVLGLSLLAWGNSGGDFSANRAVAQRGYAEMAVSGSVAAPMFNLLIGLGLSLVVACVQAENDVVDLEPDRSTIVAAVFLVVALLEIVVYARHLAHKRSLLKSHVVLSPFLGKMLLATYALFCVSIVVVVCLL